MNLRFDLILPELILTATLIVVLAAEAFRRRDEHRGLWWWTVIGTAAALVATLASPIGGSAFGGLIVADGLRRFLSATVLVAALAALLVTEPYLHRFRVPAGEVLALMLGAALGMTLLTASRHTGLLFVALELTSLPLYALTALRPGDVRGPEGGMKYFLLGSAAGAWFLLGAAVLYAASGSFQLDEAFGRLATGDPVAGLGLALLLGGLAFKLAWVPLHAWSPDAYEGAPAPVTALMSTTVKAAVVATVVRVLFAAGPPAETLRTLVLAAGIATLVAGNLLAATQTNLKRLLAYSSIAHAGYLGLGLAAATPDALAAVAAYLVVYAVMNVGAFGVLIGLARRGVELEELDDLQGLGHRRGGAALLLATFLLSLAGIPPLAGFAVKLALFGAVVDAGYTGAVVVAVLFSLVGVYYYLRPVVWMYLRFEPASYAHGELPWIQRLVLGGLALALLLVGILPAGLWRVAEAAVLQLAGG